jgi:hypothetical protein
MEAQWRRIGDYCEVSNMEIHWRRVGDYCEKASNMEVRGLYFTYLFRNYKQDKENHKLEYIRLYFCLLFCMGVKLDL